MRILIDTSVILDFALGREPFFADSTQVLRWAQDNPGEAAVAWHSLSNLAYIMSGDVRSFLQDLLSYMDVPSVGASDALQALDFPMSDIEDAMQAAAALAFGAEWIVTRNDGHSPETAACCATASSGGRGQRETQSCFTSTSSW